MSKMKHPLRVLSIDFDYFQKVSVEGLFCYPDGVDVPTSLSTSIWVSHYAQPKTREELEKVKIDKKELAYLRKILVRNSKTWKPVMIVQSHKHIYDFVMEHFAEDDYDGVQLVNVDMHADYSNDNKTSVDCGNWVSFLEKSVPKLELTWVANEISADAYKVSAELKKKMTPSLEGLLDDQFDIIFICRSDQWLPPHLDKYFDKLFNLCLELFGRIMVDNQITEPRDYEDAVKQMEEVYANMREQFKNLKV